MENKKAFPTDPTHDKDSGMDLRDYFAAMVMQGITNACYSSEEAAGALNEMSDKLGITQPTFIARSAYNYADAMLKERERK